jgi:hypothetical protein
VLDPDETVVQDDGNKAVGSGGKARCATRARQGKESGGSYQNKSTLWGNKDAGKASTLCSTDKDLLQVLQHQAVGGGIKYMRRAIRAVQTDRQMPQQSPREAEGRRESNW